MGAQKSKARLESGNADKPGVGRICDDENLGVAREMGGLVLMM